MLTSTPSDTNRGSSAAASLVSSTPGGAIPALPTTAGEDQLRGLPSEIRLKIYKLLMGEGNNIRITRRTPKNRGKKKQKPELTNYICKMPDKYKGDPLTAPFLCHTGCTKQPAEKICVSIMQASRYIYLEALPIRHEIFENNVLSFRDYRAMTRFLEAQRYFKSDSHGGLLQLSLRIEIHW